MVKNPETVQDFLEKLANKIFIKGRKNLLMVALYKKKLGFSHPLRGWDIGYYAQKLKKTSFNFDEEALKQHFPIEKVVNETLKIYEELYSVNITKGNNSVWHKEVRSFNVYNKSDGQFMGSFFMDLFPRPGKFGHSAVFPIN